MRNCQTKTPRIIRRRNLSESDLSRWIREVDKRKSAGRPKANEDKLPQPCGNLNDDRNARTSAATTADVVGTSVQVVKDVVSDNPADLPKNLQSLATHATDFDAPIYNIWKQQKKSEG